MGLKIWKDFKFLFNANFNGVDFDDTPLGPLSILSGSLGFKNALIGFRTQNISGSTLWNSEKPQTGPGDRTDFSIHITTVELQYDMISFSKFLTENNWGGLYIGLLYFAYEGLTKVNFEGLPVYYDPHSKFNGFGFSIGIDTLNGYLLYGSRLPEYLFGPEKKFTLIPWINFNTQWAWGIEETSDEVVSLIKNNPEIPPAIKDNLETSYITFYNVMDLVLGIGIKQKTKLTDVTYSLGYNALFFFGYPGQPHPLLHNEGLIFKVSFTF
jgi:hypothetical protein